MRLSGPIFSFLLLLCVAGTTSSSARPHRKLPMPTDSQALVPQDVRLRKMHLVRPDLIHYPLWIEVYC